MKNSSVVTIIIVLIVLAVIGYFFFRPRPGIAPLVPGPAPINQVQTQNGSWPAGNSPSQTNPSANVKTFTVTGSGFSFSPTTITVNKGDQVQINFKSTGGTHDFHLDAFNVATPLVSTGQSAAPVTFTADKTGSFQYYCAPHRSMGMVGTLIVK